MARPSRLPDQQDKARSDGKRAEQHPALLDALIRHAETVTG
ncbi:hypothetical protein [Kitasatospora aureofaciens]